MPPIYDFECDKCKVRIEVYRSVSEMELPPQEKEIPAGDCTHEWKKLILSAPAKSYGPGWGYGRKGSW